MLYQFLLYSQVNQLYVHMQSLFFLDFVPIQVTKDHSVVFPVLYSRFSLVIYFILNTCIYIYQSQSPFSLGVRTFVLYICLYFCFANRFICTILLESTNKQYYMIFVFLLLHSVLQSLGPSMSLQMAQFCSFLSLYIFEVT